MNLLAKRVIDLSTVGLPYHAAYSETGEGPPLLFLHGFMGRSDYWRSLVTLLNPYYRCICLDMFGFGDSSKPRIRYDIAQLSEFVRGFREAIGLESAVLVGHSLGGWVAAAHALAYPDCVKALVLIAPAGIRDDSFCGRYDHLRPLLWGTPIVDVALWLAQPIAPLLQQKMSLARLRWFRRELNAQPSARSFLVDRMRPEDAIDTVEQEIDRLQVPTLVIAGEIDETIPMWHCETYAEKIAGATLSIIPGANHDLPQDYANELASLMLPFLAERVLQKEIFIDG